MIELVPCAEEHRWLLHGWRNEPDVRRFMTRTEEISRETHDRWYSRLLTGDERRGLVAVEDGRPVGAAFVTDIDREHRRGSLGMYLAGDGVRGRGVGAATLFLVMGVAFEELGLHKFGCEVLATNPDARRLYDAFGFRHEGTLHDHLLRDGGYVDMDLLAAFEDDWSEIRSGTHPRLRERGLVQ